MAIASIAAGYNDGELNRAPFAGRIGEFFEQIGRNRAIPDLWSGISAVWAPIRPVLKLFPVYPVL
ncbi:hypothetical protein [Paenibacillus sp. GYB003]|uniref:hypothetical protein n=1 Tax=Paenibacillus sp. GYB003 TaxID=2994392 RepID=UPI002F967161